MKRSELKKLIKPIVRECVQETILNDGLLSNIVSEVAQGMGNQFLVENKEEVVPAMSNENSVQMEAIEAKRKDQLKEYSFLSKNRNTSFGNDVKDVKFYIDEALKILTFYENELSAGKTRRFDDNIIEVERVNKKQRSTRIYKIDRITGDIVMTYSGSNLKSGKWYVNNNFKWIYSGNCSSMGVIKKKF